MSNVSTVWNVLPENSTILFEAEEQQDGYMLLLVVLSILLVATLIFVSVFIACRRGAKVCAG
ncbi:hypothetical protein D4764_07G0004580 [Takifugu flavidus]|nr:hypothetical protein D4764_07G0004580 [Takifugu flavidus]